MKNRLKNVPGKHKEKIHRNSLRSRIDRKVLKVTEFMYMGIYRIFFSVLFTIFSLFAVPLSFFPFLIYADTYSEIIRLKKKENWRVIEHAFGSQIRTNLVDKRFLHSTKYYSDQFFCLFVFSILNMKNCFYFTLIYIQVSIFITHLRICSIIFLSTFFTFLTLSIFVCFLFFLIDSFSRDY